MIRRFASLALGLILLNSTPAFFTGCAGKSVSEEDPAALYADAEEDIKSDHYQIAIDKLRVIKNKFPYSKYAIDAQLRIADVLFMQEAYGEAAASYETFRDLHPKHEKVAYAMFRVGKSYFDEIPSPISRDLTPASKALDAYAEYLRRFPTDANAPEARKDAEQAKKLLAEKELYIGDFYFKRDYLISAKPRYQKILDFYPETEPAKAAKQKMIEIDLRLSENPASAKGREPVSEMMEASDREIQDLLSRKEFGKAETLIRERLREEPNSADAHYLLGVMHYFQGQVGPTVENLRRTLAIDPHHTDAAICLSVLFNDIGKYDDAKRIFEQANQSVAHKRTGSDMGIDRKFAVKHMELADLYFRYRRYDEAIEEYAKAAMLDPTTLEIRIRLAKAYAKKGFLSRAVQELQQLKNEHPHYIPARIQLGLLHYSQGNVLDAELEWEAVADIDPNNREAHAYLDMAKQARFKTQR